MSGELRPGDRFLDRFQIKYLAAEGGMASIYVAADHVSGHDIAVKALYPYYCDNATIRKRFLEEGRIQQVLRHPNILRVFDVIDEPALAILMEFIEGPTLDEYLSQHGPMSTEEVIDVIIPVMSAVGFAHSRGIVHRDIKPSNILLQNDEIRTPKILDFGVAKVKGSMQELTATGTTVGTLHYMSPEQIVGSKNIDGRADVYSLGVTMYKLVTGEVPFNAPTEFALMMAQVEATPLPPSKLRHGVSHDLEAIILKAMEKKPGHRFQTIKDFTSALLALRVRPDVSVEQTLNGVVASEIIDIALQANEVAVDRTSEAGFLILNDADIEFENSAPMASETLEIEATLKLKREPVTMPTGRAPRESTEELSNSAVRRLTKASVQLDPDDVRDKTVDHANSETAPIASLTARLAEDERTQENEKDFSSESTRPSRPSNVISERDIRIAIGSPARTEDEKDTVSMEQKITRAGLEDAPDTVESNALRGGVHVADANVDSHDMTAPKIPERDLRAVLERQQRRNAPSGRIESGPKEVMGLLPADTNELTQLRDRSKIKERMEQMNAERASRAPSHIAGVSPSSDPMEDGRIHLPVRPAATTSAESAGQHQFSQPPPPERGPGDSQRTALEFGATRPPMQTEVPRSRSNPKMIVLLIVALFVIVVALILLATLALT